jgi:tetratricopeptide (TPR) repeat protein
MKKIFVNTLITGCFLSACSFKPFDREPRSLTVSSIPGIVQDEQKLNATYSYLLYQFHDQRGEDEKAQKALAQTLQYDSESNSLRLQLATDLLERGLYASAREELFKLRDKSDEAKKIFIRVLIREGSLSEARAELDKWLLKYPKDEEFYTLRVRIEIEDKNLELAQKIVKNFLKEIPDSSQAYLLRGSLMQVKSKDKLAMADYKKSLELDSQNVTAASHLAVLQDMVGLKDEALQTYSWLAELTDNPEFHKRLGLLYMEKLDSRRAIAALEAYSIHQPKDYQNMARLAALYIQMKDYEQAEFKLSHLIVNQPKNDTVRYYYSTALFEQNKKDLALNEIRKINKESAFYPERLSMELSCLWDLGQEEKSKALAHSTALELLAKKKKTDEPLYSVLYSFLSQKKMKALAQQVLEKGLEIFPKNSNLRYVRALSFDEEGKWKEALAMGRSLLKEDSGNPALQNLVGYILADKGIDLKESERLIEAALKNKPDDPYVLDSKAWLRYKQNHLEEALSLLETCHKLKPDEPVIMIHLADILAKKGRIQDAIGWYDKAIKKGIDAVHERIRVQESLARYQIANDRKISCSSGGLCSSK